ncbi:DUF2254 domain-containing protein [Micrococcoides hystricis]|uniref:DUF2254 domain-containing protein n=1 Tax=Micrococcoides hystricis TaxID=1572761 RepID=A0ABV6P6L6_9MICC
MREYLYRVKDSIRTELWPVPLIALLLAVVLGLSLPELDRASYASATDNPRWPWVFSGGPDAARDVLTTISGSLMTVTSLTFSLTVVTLQLASSQFSPRLLRNFTADRFVHVTLAVFLGSFTYSLFVLTAVRTEDESGPEFVPHLSVTFAIILALASVFALVLFLAHLAREIRVEMVMKNVRAETARQIEQIYPEYTTDFQPIPDEPNERILRLRSRKSGFLAAVDTQALLRAAEETNTMIRFDAKVGDSVIEGAPHISIWPGPGSSGISGEQHERLKSAFLDATTVNSERSVLNQPEFGLRQLSDIACKALSPGVNDPTTAQDAMVHIGSLLGVASNRVTGPRLFRDETGQPRLLVNQHTFADLLDTGLTQLRVYSEADPVVLRRLANMLRDIAWADRSKRHEAEIQVHLDRLSESVNRCAHIEADKKEIRAALDDARVALKRNL